MSTSSTITITKQQEIPLTKEQKQFNQLNSQIYKTRDLLLQWQNSISNFQTTYTNNFLPLINQHNELRIKIAYLFDELYDNKIFTKADRKKMLYVISEIALEFADDNIQLKEIYNKRNNSDYDEEQEAEKDMVIEYIKASASEEFDIDLEEIDSNDPDEYLDEFMKKMHERSEYEQEINLKHKANTKKSRKEAQKIAEEKNISQSIREIYRQLARTLHPDRETEITEHERKTELMKKVNAAYDKQDLITLLQIQLEIEQINQNSINSLSTQKVKHYNTVLKRQLQELKQEINFVCDRFFMEFDIPIMGKLTPDAIINTLYLDIKNTKINIKALRQNLKQWNDHKKLKQYIKQLIIS